MTCPHPEKHRHVSKAAALKHLEVMDRTKEVDLGLKPYPCGDHWHLGHRGHPPLNVAIRLALRAGSKNSRRRRRKR